MYDYLSGPRFLTSYFLQIKNKVFNILIMAGLNVNKNRNVSLEHMLELYLLFEIKPNFL